MLCSSDTLKMGSLSMSFSSAFPSLSRPKEVKIMTRDEYNLVTRRMQGLSILTIEFARITNRSMSVDSGYKNGIPILLSEAYSAIRNCAVGWVEEVT